MFRAPFADTFLSRTQPTAYVAQLLSPESLQRTGYFAPEKVRTCYQAFLAGRRAMGRWVFLEMGLTSVVATQLWHHLFLGGGLCELPTWSDSGAARASAMRHAG